MEKNVYKWSTVVSIKETDLSGSVYYLNYLSWCAKARELFALDNYKHFGSAYSFIIQSVEHNFLGGAKFQDTIEIEIQIDEVTFTSAKMILSIYKVDEQGKILIGTQSQKLVTVDIQRGRPMRIPLEVQEVLQHYHVGMDC